MCDGDGGMCGDESDLQRRLDELEALSSIYPDAVAAGGNNRSVDADISSGGDSPSKATIRLHVSMPEDYPSRSPPTYELSAPFLRAAEKEALAADMERAAADNVGQCVVFAWMETIRFGHTRTLSQKEAQAQYKNFFFRFFFSNLNLNLKSNMYQYVMNASESFWTAG